MSGIVATIVNRNDAGVRSDTTKLFKRSQERGDDARAYAIQEMALPLHGLPLPYIEKDSAHAASRKPYQIEHDMEKLQQSKFVLLGCTYGKPATETRLDLDLVPPFYDYTNKKRSWIVAIDGAVTGYTGQQVVEILNSQGWPAVTKLPGQYAIVAIDRGDPFTLYWAAKAKPLFALKDALNQTLRIASQKEYFYGMWHKLRSPAPVELGPYEYGTITFEGILSRNPYDTKTGRGSLVLCGGGLDSCVAAYDILASYPDEPMTLLYVDYGCRATSREYAATQSIASGLRDIAKSVIFTEKVSTDFFRRIGNSSLIPSFSQGVSHNPQRGQPSEWVPARNTFLMAMAVSMAESRGLARIVTGINQDAASAYPDNEQQWLTQWQALIPYAVNLDRSLELEAPLQGLTKTEIVKLGNKLGIPWETVLTWSCYEGDRDHCGSCSSCRYRRGAFAAARTTDPTIYKE